MNYKDHAKNEFFYSGWTDKDGNFDDSMQELMCNQVLELLDLFSTHGHSGFSAPYALNLFKNLASFDSISPLSGEDEEWTEPYDDEGSQQNKRQSDVFRDAKGNAYWSSGRIFIDSSGCSFTSSKSRIPISFPWSKPDPEYIRVSEDKDGNTIYPDGI